MKKLILATIFLLCSCHLFAGNSDSAAQQLLIAANQQANLFHRDTGPFQLDADFVAQVQVPLQGHMTLKWESNDHWWRKIVMSDFVQVDVRNGDKQYTSRNAGFTPPRIHELITLLQFADRLEGAVKKQKQRIENGIELTCFRVESVRGTAHEVCVNPASREILKNEWKNAPDEQRIERYAEYFDFQGHRYPRKLELLVNGSKVITANVADLTTSAFDQALLVAPKGAIERRHCKGMTQVLPVKTPEPMYPTSASQNRLMGDTMVSITVLTDGSVGDIHLLGSATQSMDDATLQTLKGWRFKPAMCGSEPVVSDIDVVVSFRLR
jgi:TonB family protein